jgi:hypothetical protein
MGVIDTEKKLTRKVPFYSVVRDGWGWVRECAKPKGRSCGRCVLKNRCFVEGR